MPITRRSTTRTRDTIRDPRAVAVCLAATIGALAGIGQLLIAQASGVLFHTGETMIGPHETVDQSAIIIWIAAAAVCLGATAPRLYLKTAPGRRLRLVLAGVAACGALLSAPVAAATAAWAQVYGSDLSQPNVLRLVIFGVVLGALISAFAVRSNAALWSLAGWVAVVWVLLVASAALDPNVTPAISQWDPGPRWSSSSRSMQGSLLLLVVAALLGTVLGVADIKLRWRRSLRRHRSAAPLLAVCGPLVVLVAYLIAGLVTGVFNPHRLAALIAAGMLIVAGSWVGAWLTQRSRSDRADGRIDA